MSVIVRGMKMPKKCLTCPCLEYNMFDDDIDGYCKTLKTKITNSDERHPNCPLVEIPTSHGRLIDADEMIRIWDGATFDGSVKPLIDARPTVIEAEGRNE